MIYRCVVWQRSLFLKLIFIAAKFRQVDFSVFVIYCINWNLLYGPPLGGWVTRCTPSVRLSVCPSLCPSVCTVPTVNSKTENRTTFKLREEITHARREWLAEQFWGNLVYPVKIGRTFLSTVCSSFSIDVSEKYLITIYLCIYLSIYLSIHLSIHPSIHPSI